jgi:hypothetical protein
LIAAALIAGGTGAAAQDLLGQYFALIGPEDFYNSSGRFLGDPCAILQQDRANFHRFGIRHDGDQPDPFFADRAARGVLGQSCYLANPAEGYVVDRLRSGQTKYLWIKVYGYGGRVAFVTFQEGAG